jgi:hypothetical protein
MAVGVVIGAAFFIDLSGAGHETLAATQAAGAAALDHGLFTSATLGLSIAALFLRLRQPPVSRISRSRMRCTRFITRRWIFSAGISR